MPSFPEPSQWPDRTDFENPEQHSCHPEKLSFVLLVQVKIYINPLQMQILSYRSRNTTNINLKHSSLDGIKVASIWVPRHCWQHPEGNQNLSSPCGWWHTPANLSTQEAEAESLVWVWRQPELDSGFQSRQGCRKSVCVSISHSCHNDNNMETVIIIIIFIYTFEPCIIFWDSVLFLCIW